MALRLVAAFVVACLTLTTSAQQTVALSKSAAAIKQRADTLKPQAKISVIPRSGSEEFGTFVSNNDEGFTFIDVDRNTTVTMRYEDVKKLKDGYGGYNSVQQRHTDRTKGLVVAVIAVGALGGLIAAVATAKD